MDFSVESREFGNAIMRLAIAGNLDAGTDHLLQQAIHDALASQRVKGIIIDLDEVPVVDDDGIRAIQNSYWIAYRADVPFLVVNAHSDRTRSILDKAGILTAMSRT